MSSGEHLEARLARVVDDVWRSLAEAAGTAEPPTATPEEAAADTADLCGHVAVALRELAARPRPAATYSAPPPAGARPVLDLRR